MISVTKLLCGQAAQGDALRYRWRQAAGQTAQGALERRPIVVWNSTKACNLACLHCYYSAHREPAPDEMDTARAKAMIDDLAAFGAPVVLFSGGEPLLRSDLYELGAYAVDKGLRAVISTNGTLIGAEEARRIHEAGFSYVGISLDGIGETNDRFRGSSGAFEATLAGLRRCREAGVRTGLRLTLNRHNAQDLEAILDLLEEERIPRACFYHLVYTGRGRHLVPDDLSPDGDARRHRRLCDRALRWQRSGVDCELLTVDNHADGPYLLRRVEREQPDRREEVLALLRANGGNASGVGIAAVDHAGNVHADQFWQHYSFGNVGERPFGDIWTDTSDALMAGLKQRAPLLKGRCARCRYLDICNGNFRVRAEAVHGDVWAPDPACYLSDDEIGGQGPCDHN